jgi:hypothetical protein
MSEQEIDVRRYWSAITARWWLPAVGLIAGAAIAYAVSLGGADVWRGTALVYLGQPVTPSGAQVQSLSTNPATAAEIAGSTAAQRRAERELRMRRGELNGRVSVAAVKGNVSRLGQNPLVRIRVEGDSRRVAPAATALAREIVKRVSGYADAKIAVLEEAIEQGDAELARLDEQLDGASADAGFLVLRRGELFDDLVTQKQNLALAQEVERARVVEEAVARKVTAQSRRNQIVVGAFLGLLLGLAAALLWESLLALRRR